MAGRITSRQKCPACVRSGKYHIEEFRPGERGLKCECGGFWATRPIIEIKYKGRLYRITCDKIGQRFPAHLQPVETALGQIRADIKGHIFYPEHWAPTTSNIISLEKLFGWVSQKGTRPVCTLLVWNASV